MLQSTPEGGNDVVCLTLRTDGHIVAVTQRKSRSSSEQNGELFSCSEGENDQSTPYDAKSGGPTTVWRCENKFILTFRRINARF